MIASSLAVLALIFTLLAASATVCPGNTTPAGTIEAKITVNGSSIVQSILVCKSGKAGKIALVWDGIAVEFDLASLLTSSAKGWRAEPQAGRAAIVGKSVEAVTATVEEPACPTSEALEARPPAHLTRTIGKVEASEYQLVMRVAVATGVGVVAGAVAYLWLARKL